MKPTTSSIHTTVLALIVLLMCVPSITAQGSLDIAPAIFTSTLPEIQSLNHIDRQQEDVLHYTRSAAFKQAGIYTLRLAEYNEMLEVSSKLENSTLAKRIEYYAAATLNAYTLIVELIDQYPELSIIDRRTMLVFFQEMLQIMSDYNIALTGGEENLLDTLDRLELLEGVKSKIEELLGVVEGIHELVINNINGRQVDLRISLDNYNN